MLEESTKKKTLGCIGGSCLTTLIVVVVVFGLLVGVCGLIVATSR